MIRAALVGIGGIGRAHLKNYIKFTEEGDIIKLVAACDINPEKFKNVPVDFNLEEGKGDINFGGLHLYTDMDEMIAKEKIDMVTLALPTYMHCEVTCKFLEHGINVLCEKPMALDLEQCTRMIETSRRTGKKLMIGQCLRFWDEYEMLKDYINTEKYGKPVAGFFYRGGGTPMWSYENWLQHKELGGGAIFDQHVHDVDTVAYLYGMPKAVSSIALNVIPGSNYDSVATNYIYDSGIVIHSQNDWTYSGIGFYMGYKANFTGGTVVYDNGFNAAEKGGKMLPVEYTKTNAYYNETREFAKAIETGDTTSIDRNRPEASRETVRLVLAEIESAQKHGEMVTL